jgi:hypothetical protein
MPGVTTVTDKVITFTPDTIYAAKTEYKAVLKGITNKEGKKLNDITLSFTPAYIPYAELPENIKKTLNADSSDVRKPYAPEVIVIGGLPALTERGFSEGQVTSLRTALYTYFASQKQEVRVVDFTDIDKPPFDPNDPSNLDRFHFNVAIDGKTVYKGTIEYGLTSMRLYLNNPTSNAVIFDSGTIDPAE